MDFTINKHKSLREQYEDGIELIHIKNLLYFDSNIVDIEANYSLKVTIKERSELEIVKAYKKEGKKMLIIKVNLIELKRNYQENLYDIPLNFYPLEVQKEIILKQLEYFKKMKFGNRYFVYPTEFKQIDIEDVKQIKIIKTLLILESEGHIILNDINFTMKHSMMGGILLNLTINRDSILMFGDIIIDVYNQTIRIAGNLVKIDDLEENKKTRGRQGVMTLYALLKINNEIIGIKSEPNEIIVDFDKKDKESFKNYFNEASKKLTILNTTLSYSGNLIKGYFSGARELLKMYNSFLNIPENSRSTKKYENIYRIEKKHKSQHM